MNRKILNFLSVFLLLVGLTSIHQQMNAQTYCTPVYTTGCSSQDDINSFSMSGSAGTSISHLNTGCASATSLGYSNYTGTVTPVTVYPDSVYTGTVTTNYSGSEYVKIWIDFNNNGTFDVAELLYTSPSFGSATPANFSITIPTTAPYGMHRMRVRLVFASTTFDACASATYGETHDYNVFVGSTVACSGTPTAGTATSNLTGNCINSQVNLGLTGNTAANGLSFQWQSASSATGPWTNLTNNTAQPSHIATLSGLTNYFRCYVGCGTSTADTSTVVAVTGYPSLPAGTYTIDPAGSGLNNFTSFTQAVSALSCGVAGPVVFNVAPGTYTEQVTFPNILFTSSTNTVTFNGNGATLTYAGNASSTANRTTLTLNDADYIKFDSLNIVTTGGTYGFGVLLTNNADNNIFNRCNITSSTTSTGSGIASFAISGSTTSPTSTGSNCDSNTVSNCTITGGYYGISIMGVSATVPVYRNNIINTKVKDFYVYGLYNYSNAEALIQGNEISRPTRTNSGTTYGLMIYYNSSGTIIERNSIKDLFAAQTASTSSLYMYYLYTFSGYLTSPIHVRNNINEAQSGNGSKYFMYFTGENQKIYHNTIVASSTTNSTTTSKYALYRTGNYNSGFEFKNNIVYYSFPNAATGANHYLLYNSSIGSLGNAGGNAYYIDPVNTTAQFCYDAGTNYSTLALYKAAKGMDMSSLVVNPQFNTPFTNLTPQAYPYDNYCGSVGVTTDFYGLPRNTTNPDFGAIEFAAPPCSGVPTAGTATVSDTNICANFSIMLGLTGNSYGAGMTYTWQFDTSATGSFATNLNTSVASGYSTNAVEGYYRCKLVCGGTDSSYSAPIYVNTNPPLAGGTYTINSTVATGGTNFQTIGNFMAAIKCGITGPIVANVVTGTGPYNEQAIFPSYIPGSSSTNTVTLNGNGETITFAPPTGMKAVVVLPGTDHIRLQNFKIVATGAQGWGVSLSQGADSNIISNNIIFVDSTSTSSVYTGIALSSDISSPTTTSTNTNDYNQILNNTINGGYYGITLMGGSTTVFAESNIIKGNKLRNFYLYGMYIYYVHNCLIDSNDLSRTSRTSTSTVYGIYNYAGSGGLKITRNKLHNLFDGTPTSTSGFYGLYLSSSSAPTGEENLVANNEIFNIFNEGSQYFIYPYACNNTKIVHNTLSMDNVLSVATATYSLYGIYHTFASTSIIKNNNINMTQAGASKKYGLYYSGLPAQSDYNNVWFNSAATTSYYGYAGGALQTTLAAFQTASTKDSNSKNIDPMIPALSADLTPQNSLLDNLGAPVGITKDITGKIRSTSTPDIGSREFPVCAPVNMNINITSINNTSQVASGNICIGDTAILKAPTGLNGYQWQFNGSSISGAVDSIFKTVTPGAYNVILDSAGCVGTQDPSITINVNPLPTIWGGTDTAVCQGTQYTLQGAGAGSSGTYIWNNNITNNTPFTVSSTNTYTVVGTDSLGCTNSDTVTVAMNPLPDAGVISAVNIGGDPQLVYSFSSTATNASTYSWNFGGGFTSNKAIDTITYTTKGLYSIQLIVSNGCGSDTAYLENVPVNNRTIINSNLMSIYPNPASDFINVVNFSTEAITNIHVLNSIGQVVMNEYEPNGNKAAKVNLNKLAAGTYIIKVVCSEHEYILPFTKK